MEYIIVSPDPSVSRRDGAVYTWQVVLADIKNF